MDTRKRIDEAVQQTGLSRYELAKRIADRGVCSSRTAYRALTDATTMQLAVLDAIWDELKQGEQGDAV